MKEPGYSDLAILNSKGTDVITVCRLGLTEVYPKNYNQSVG